MTHTVTLIPGDDPGTELAPIVKRVVAAAGVDIRWETVPAGREAFELAGDPLPEETIASIRRHRVALKGRLWTPVGTGYASPDRRLRRALDLYAVKRPVRCLPGLPSRHADVDLVVLHEGTEDVNVGLEHQVSPGVIQSIKVTTRAACLRIARYAFEYAHRHGRSQVTLVHKANIMKLSDGLFMRCGEEVAQQYPGVELRTIIADNACMQLASAPGQFDVLVAQNLFGGILADLGAGLVGGTSAVWGELCGDDGVRVFEALHGFAPELTGRGVANPLPFLLPTVALLEQLGEAEAASRLRGAISRTLQTGLRSPDLGGAATTGELAAAIIARLE